MPGRALRDLMSAVHDRMPLAPQPGAAAGVPKVDGPRTATPGRSRANGLSAEWQVRGILFLIAAEAVLYGFSYPFFSLALEKRELANWLIGLNASLAGAGILLVGPFLPRLIAICGLRRLVAGLFAISLLSFAALLVADNVIVWFASRFVMGACFSALWPTTEVWLNGVVDEHRRGRVFGASATLYAGAQFLGPLALGVTGSIGALPIVAAMVPLAIGLFVALSLRKDVSHHTDAELRPKESLRLAYVLAGPLVALAFLAGVAETSMQSLLPIYGLSLGLGETQASWLVALFSLGEAVLVGLVGIFADRFGRGRMLRFCAIPAIAIAICLPFSGAGIGVLGPLLFLAGGTISGIYTLGVILIGQDFRGQRLAVVATGFAMAYSAGAVSGSTPIGFLIDLFGPGALPLAIAVSFVGLGVIALTRTDQHATASRTIRQDNRRSGRDQGEGVDVEQAAIGDLQMRDDRKRQERDLQEGLFEPAAKVAGGRA